jgi:uncharacterized protein
MLIMNKNRYLTGFIAQDLKEKFVFLGGPRQVGKTTTALTFLGVNADKKHPAYFNWDIPQTHQKLIKGLIPEREAIIILDEIHKYARWRNLVKGYYDLYFPEKTFLITGSARLDYYKKGGDSLHGRYHYLRLHPFTLNELNSQPSQSDLEILLRFGGFPEPLFSSSDRVHRRWSLERMARIIQEDLTSLERIREVSLVELLVDALPEKVGSPLSIQSLREDLQLAHETVERWIRILENLYVCFRIAPFGAPTIRAVKKEQKIYFWDWSQVTHPGPRFENLVASHLLKYCHFIQDTEGHKMELRYLRLQDSREIDFVVIKDKKPLFAVECKLSDKEPVAPVLHYVSDRTPIPVIYQTHMGTEDRYVTKKIRVIPFRKLSVELSLV